MLVEMLAKLLITATFQMMYKMAINVLQTKQNGGISRGQVNLKYDILLEEETDNEFLVIYEWSNTPAFENLTWKCMPPLPLHLIYSRINYHRCLVLHNYLGRVPSAEQKALNWPCQKIIIINLTKPNQRGIPCPNLMGSTFLT